MLSFKLETTWILAETTSSYFIGFSNTMKFTNAISDASDEDLSSAKEVLRSINCSGI